MTAGQGDAVVADRAGIRPYGPQDADWPMGTDGRSWPLTREGYLRWLLGRIDGYGNETLEPVRSLVDDGLVSLHEKPLSQPPRITLSGIAYLARVDAGRVEETAVA